MKSVPAAGNCWKKCMKKENDPKMSFLKKRLFGEAGRRARFCSKELKLEKVKIIEIQ